MVRWERRGRVHLARRNLLAEPLRLAISVLGVAFAVMLVAVVLALFRGWSGIGGIISQLPGSLWVTQAGVTDPFYTSSVLSDDTVGRIVGRTDVSATVPVRARQIGFEFEGETGSLFVMSLALPATAVPPELRERFLPEPGEIVVDRALQRKAGVSLGDVITINRVPLTIARLTSDGNAVVTQFAFIEQTDARQVFAPIDNAAYLLLEPAPGISVEELRARIEREHPEVAVFTGAEFEATISDLIDDTFLPVVTIILLLGVVVGGAVVGLTIYTATFERRREYAVLKALGASRGMLVGVVVSQALAVTLIGTMVGLVAAVGVAWLAEEAAPAFVTEVRWQDLASILAGSGVVAIAAAVLPIRSVAEVDPASVFRA